MSEHAQRDYLARWNALARTDLWRDIVAQIDKIEAEALDELRARGSLASTAAMETTRVVEQVRDGIRALVVEAGDLPFDIFDPPEE